MSIDDYEYGIGPARRNGAWDGQIYHDGMSRQQAREWLDEIDSLMLRSMFVIIRRHPNKKWNISF